MRVYALQISGLDEEIEAKLVRTVKPHTTPVVSISIDSTSTLLATGGADGVVKVWDIRGGFVTHTFHGHSGLISALHFFHVDPEDEEQPVKSKKRKNRQRNEEVEEVQNDATAGYRLASGGEDGKVRIWDLHKRKSMATLDSHVSVVRSLEYSSERKLLLSASRDKTVIMWDSRTWSNASTVAVLESIEGAGFLEKGRLFYTAGETARLRIWSTDGGREVTEDQESGSEVEAILDVLHFPTLPFLLTVHADQTLILRDVTPLAGITSSQQIPALPIIQRISGTHDEVIDLAYVGRDRSLLALATNLEDIRIISLKTETSLGDDSAPYFGADVASLKGHEEIIITIDTDWSGHWLATGAKDNTAKLWRLDPENDSYTCYATFTGHAESIGAVSLPNASPPVGSKEYESPLDHPPKFMITGSQDKTIKRWDIASTGKGPRAAYTRKAHDKDINAIETSYSSPALFASASQDRTVKIWDVETGEAIGVLRGHKRGVWTVAFSPVGMPALTTGEGGAASTARGMIVTGSGDKTVKIWKLTDYSCLRTFEGHANSVLKVVWLPPPTKDGKDKRGIQVGSAAGDGLVKVWNAQDSECAATLDNHIDRVWALAVKPAPILTTAEQKLLKADDVDDEVEDNHTSTLELVSGSADSTLTFWIDTTATTAMQATTQATARIEQDQELQNHIRANNFREAIVLALQLNHPKRLLELFRTVIEKGNDPGSFTGKTEVDEVLATLSASQLWNLLRRIRDWNANGRTHHVAQRVLYALLRIYPKERLLSLQKRRKAAPDSVQDENVDEALAGAMAELSTKEKSKESVKDVVDALKAYTERHYTRLEKTGEERFVLLWALGQMDDVSGMKGIENGYANGHGEEHEEDVLMLDEA
jgi:U3 small nucleolar RNA-associated protein 13